MNEKKMNWTVYLCGRYSVTFDSELLTAQKTFLSLAELELDTLSAEEMKRIPQLARTLLSGWMRRRFL